VAERQYSLDEIFSKNKEFQLAVTGKVLEHLIS
jgi:hypothetical protein